MKITTIGLDLAKQVFQVHGVDAHGLNRPGFSRRSRFSKSAHSRILPVNDRRHAVTPPRVVEHLDVVEDIRYGLSAGGVDAAANALALEQMEEALGHGVVMAITPAAHTGFESMGL